MKEMTVVVGRSLIAAALPMMAAYLLAFEMFPSAFHEDNASAAVAGCGYIGAAVSLLATGKALGRLLRLRLLLSLIASGATLAAILMSPTNLSELLMTLFVVAVASSLPLLLLGVLDQIRARQRTDQGEAVSARDADVLATGRFMAVAWNLVLFLLWTTVDFNEMSSIAWWLGTACMLNGSVEVFPGMLGELRFVWSEITRPTSMTIEPAGGRTWSDDESDDGDLDWSPSGSGMSQRYDLGYSEARLINPSTGFEMDGGLDSAGYTFGEDPDPHGDFM